VFRSSAPAGLWRLAGHQGGRVAQSLPWIYRL